MQDHPILGAVLIAIGVALVGLSYFSAHAVNAIPPIIAGNVIALNGVVFVILAARKLLLTRRQIWMTR